MTARGQQEAGSAPALVTVENWQASCLGGGDGGRALEGGGRGRQARGQEEARVGWKDSSLYCF